MISRFFKIQMRNPPRKVPRSAKHTTNNSSIINETLAHPLCITLRQSTCCIQSQTATVPAAWTERSSRRVVQQLRFTKQLVSEPGLEAYTQRFQSGCCHSVPSFDLVLPTGRSAHHFPRRLRVYLVFDSSQTGLPVCTASLSPTGRPPTKFVALRLALAMYAAVC